MRPSTSARERSSFAISIAVKSITATKNRIAAKLEIDVEGADEVKRKVVTVKVRHLDRYGRLVTRVVTDGKDVSHELLKAGLARHFKKYSSDPELAELEIKAGEAKVGIWSARNAPLSWEDANATSRRGQGRERGPVSRLRPQQGLSSGQLPVLRVPELHCRF